MLSRTTFIVDRKGKQATERLDLVYDVRTDSRKIPEPHGIRLRPNMANQNFIAARVSLYVPDIFSLAIYTNFISKRGTEGFNYTLRCAVDKCYSNLQRLSFRQVLEQYYLEMRDYVLSEYPWLRIFQGAWALSWLLARPWLCRNKNRRTEIKRFKSSKIHTFTELQILNVGQQQRVVT